MISIAITAGAAALMIISGVLASCSDLAAIVASSARAA
jgi:hypothetical protein